MELKTGKKGTNDLIAVVHFKEASNFNPKDLTWVPTIKELNLLMAAKKAIMEKEE